MSGRGHIKLDIDRGLDRLLKMRAPGQRFSHETIAKACCCHLRTIQFIEEHALWKMQWPLRDVAREEGLRAEMKMHPAVKRKAARRTK